MSEVKGLLDNCLKISHQKTKMAYLIKWTTSGDPIVGSGSVIEMKDCISTNIGMMEFIFPLVVTEH